MLIKESTREPLFGAFLRGDTRRMCSWWSHNLRTNRLLEKVEPGRTSCVDAHVVGLEVSISDVLAVQVPQREGKLRRAHPALKTVQ